VGRGDGDDRLRWGLNGQSGLGGRNVKGLELSQRFFEEVGFPAIREHLPECVPHIAAGLSGGSQSHGNDDETICALSQVASSRVFEVAKTRR